MRALIPSSQSLLPSSAEAVEVCRELSYCDMDCNQSLGKRLRKHGAGHGCGDRSYGNYSFIIRLKALKRKPVFNIVCISVLVSFLLEEDPRHYSAWLVLDELGQLPFMERSKVPFVRSGHTLPSYTSDIQSLDSTCGYFRWCL